MDFFKPNGEWYATDEMVWLYYSGMLIHEAFKASLDASFQGDFSGMTAVCLHPYHEHTHPIMLNNWDNYQT